jgi:hypothetical protein
MKPDVNSVEVHLQPSHNGHPVDGVLVGAGSLWPICVVPSGLAWGTCSGSSRMRYTMGTHIFFLQIG